MSPRANHHHVRKPHSESDFAFQNKRVKADIITGNLAKKLSRLSSNEVRNSTKN